MDTSLPVTRETAEFLLGLLKQQQLAVGAPDFEPVVRAVLKAITELQACLDS